MLLLFYPIALFLIDNPDGLLLDNLCLKDLNYDNYPLYLIIERNFLPLLGDSSHSPVYRGSLRVDGVGDYRVDLV